MENELRIAVADDEEIVHQMFEVIVRQGPIPMVVVGHFYSGGEVVRAVPDVGADVLFLDIVMPEKDGLAVAEQIGRSVRPPKIVIISAYDEFRFVQGALRLGVLDYLLKPIRPADVYRVCERIRPSVATDLSELSGGKGEVAREIPEPVQRALEFVEAQLSRRVTMKDMAAKVFLSPSYFSRIFSETMGMPFVKYVTRVRLEKAKVLLRETDLSVSEIARAVGYPDAAYFSRVFKGEVGLSPSGFRRKS